VEAEGVVKIPQLASFPIFFLSLWVSRVIFLYQLFTTNLFRFIHPFADGDGRTGRLWQSLILARWNPLFGDIPVESQIFEHQAEYYHAIHESTQKTDSVPFIAFMLRMILDTVTSSTPEVTQEVTPEVRLLSILAGEMTRQQLKEALGLKDDEHFRKAYLLPALEAGLIEMDWGIIVSASRVSDTLKAELGAMASRFKTEEEWLRGVRAHLGEIFEDPAEYVDSWDLENTEAVTASMIGSIAAKLRDRVDSVLSTPMSKRGTRSW
jgi:hypothetical protein